ncbi:hypothetical protein [Hydrogenophaga sp. MI9]|uniref:hypothetical protein n=1 Tax=Hydrogenophaga sp. MI9 TaxID=3453719 RepID=UPI003EEB8CD4
MIRCVKLVSALVLVGGLLVACGGSKDPAQTSGATAVPSSATSAQALAVQQVGANLNAQELQRLASKSTTTQVAEPPPWFSSYSVVFRVYNPRTRGYFFTNSRAELDQLVFAQPDVKSEGPAFVVLNDPNARPVYRFYDAQRGVHFYTISEAERAHVVANLPRFSYEGIAFMAHAVPGAGYVPLYRFFSVRDGVHFYTASPVEAAAVRAQSTYLDEGIAFYVMPEPGLMQIADAGLAWISEQDSPPLSPAEVLDPVSFRGTGFAFGSASHTPARQHLLIRDAQGWQSFLDSTAGDMTLIDPVPAVDFSTQQILALNLANTSGCGGDRMLQTLRSGSVVQVVVENFVPAPDVMCTAIYQPLPQFLVIPRTETVQVTRLSLAF